MISSLHIATCSESPRPDCQLSEERIKFKADPIWAEVSDVICVLDTEVLCDLLDEQLSLLKLSAVVGSNVSNHQYPNCALFYASEDFTNVFSIATHAEKPKGVSANLLSNICRIDSETSPKK